MDLWQQLCSSHELQELKQNVLVVQETPVSVPFDGLPHAVDDFENPDDIVFDFALYVRWVFTRHGENDVVYILNVLGELQFSRGFLHLDCEYFAHTWVFKLNLVQNFRGYLLAFPTLKLSQGLLDMV